MAQEEGVGVQEAMRQVRPKGRASKKGKGQGKINERQGKRQDRAWDKSRDKMQNKRQGRMTKVKQKMSPMGRPDAR